MNLKTVMTHGELMFLLKIITRLGCFDITRLTVPTEKQMGWVVETANNVFGVGPNLLMELPDGTTSVNPDPANCLNAKFTFTQPIHEVDGLLYLCSTFSWRFVNLNEAFDKAIHKPYDTQKQF